MRGATHAVTSPHGRRVMHVLAPARQGGLERVVEMLAMVQGARAHVAAILTPSDAEDHPYVQALRERGVAVHVVSSPGRAYRQEHRALRALFAAERPDIVHTHGYRADILGGMAARREGIATVSTAHGFVGGSVRNRVTESIQRFALRYSDAVIAVSRPLVTRLTAAGVPARAIHFVANAYAPQGTLASRADARHALQLDPTARIVAWVGRLSSEKGPDVMLASLASAPAAWRLSMVGDGGEHAQLVQQAAALHVTERVTWHGAVARAGTLLQAFDAYVLSSRTEGTPIALFEAMAAGIPIIATRVGGVPDVVTDAEAILVPPERPDAIAEALGAILQDPNAAAARAIAAQHRVTTAFGAEAWARAVDEVYDAAVRHRSRT